MIYAFFPTLFPSLSLSLFSTICSVLFCSLYIYHCIREIYTLYIADEREGERFGLISEIAFAYGAAENVDDLQLGSGINTGIIIITTETYLNMYLLNIDIRHNTNLVQINNKVLGIESFALCSPWSVS